MSGSTAGIQNREHVNLEGRAAATLEIAPPSAAIPAAEPGITYVLPIRSERRADSAELTGYLRWLAARSEVIVVDGSPPEVFAAHAASWSGFARHLPPDPDLETPMGKVGGVLTGVRRASHELLVIADDDVRYDAQGLSRMAALLGDHHVVRPQNFFDPLPWHARWDTGRMLLNRMTGGDWPGTLGVRRSALRATGGYRGDVMFENLELVRTVLAAGGREAVPLDLFVRRLPCTARHFRSQRVRQAYDELARPARLAVALAVLPLAAGLAAAGRWVALGGGALAVAGLAELGRRRGSGRRAFPFSASLLAPAWLAERAVCSWLALGSRLLHGGVRYRGTVLRRPASPMRELRARHAGALAAAGKETAPPDNPFDGELARAHSSYGGYREGRLVRLPDLSPLPPIAELVHDSFRALVLSPRFPCVGAKAALGRGDYRMGLYGEMGSPEATAGLARDLFTFVHERRRMEGRFSTFVASFTHPIVADEREFERRLWAQLERLHELDAPHHAWDPAVSSDPEDPAFSFSFAGSAFFVVGLHPASSRWTRRFAWPTLVWNAHDQFETLREEGRYAPLQQAIREREIALQGSLNPNLSDFGDRSEAREYSGRAVGKEWKCPFHRARRAAPETGK